MLFIVDRGFFSNENINLFSSNGNEYTILLAKNQDGCKKAVHSLEMHDRFLYYLRHMALGHKAYTQEGFEKQKFIRVKPQGGIS